MTRENMIDLDMSLKNVQHVLREDMRLFRVWRKIKEAREILEEQIWPLVETKY